MPGQPGCRATRIELIQAQGDNGLGAAMDGLSTLLWPRRRNNLGPSDHPPPPPDVGSVSFLIGTTYADVSNDELIGRAFGRVMDLARQRIDSIRIASGAKIPAMSFARCHALYFWFLIDEEGATMTKRSSLTGTGRQSSDQARSPKTSKFKLTIF